MWDSNPGLTPKWVLLSLIYVVSLASFYSFFTSQKLHVVFLQWVPMVVAVEAMEVQKRGQVGGAITYFKVCSKVLLKNIHST